MGILWKFLVIFYGGFDDVGDLIGIFGWDEICIRD